MLLSAQRVAPTGMAYGVDLTEQMVALARRNQAQAGVQNAEFLLGSIEALPLADDSVDVVISNCVINLVGDKSQVLREAARVLRRGGRFAVSDVVADEGMDAATRADMAEWNRLYRRGTDRGRVPGAPARRRIRGHRSAPQPPRARSGGVGGDSRRAAVERPRPRRVPGPRNPAEWS